MKRTLLLAFAAIPVLFSGCATPQPPQAFHATDNNAIVIKSVDNRTSEIIQPTVSGPIGNDTVLNKITSLSGSKTAVVILENYTESQIGDEFRSRGTPWFVGLRSLGYEHIVFLQGQGSSNPEGLLTLAKYD